ncbi:MAG: NUDIX hydrolase [Burkholderiaceae bacterium]
MKFCSNCAAPVTQEVPPGDNRLRFCCAGCDTVHYQNPNMVVGTVPVSGNRVLLCKRAIEPRLGYWTLPAGFMEHKETLAEGAARETTEEAGIDFKLGELFSVLSVPHVGQVHLFYLADMQSEKIEPGPETIEAALFEEADIPWDKIAFQTVEKTLRWYFQDRDAGNWLVHSDDIRYNRRPK